MIVKDEKAAFEKGYSLELLLFAALATASAFLTFSLLPGTASRTKLVQPANGSARLPGMLEAEALTVVRKSRAFGLGPQSTKGWGADGTWSNDAHLFAATTLGDFLELELPVSTRGPRAVTVYLSRGGDYGTLRLFVNGKRVSPDIDTGPPSRREGLIATVDAGVHELSGKGDVLRLEVVGKGARSHAPYYQFAVDGVVLRPQRAGEESR